MKKREKALKTPKKLRKTQIFEGILANLSLRQGQHDGRYAFPGPSQFHRVCSTFL